MAEHLSTRRADIGATMGEWIDAAPVAMLVADRQGRILVANRAGCLLFGYSAEQLCGMHVEDLMPEPFRPAHHKHVGQFFDAQAPRLMGAGRNVVAVDASGRVFPAEIGLSLADTPMGRCVVAAIVDVTERRKRDRESTLARMVQEAMLPRIPTDWEGVEIAARSEPADATGGDFYDLLQFPDGRVGFVIGDASGHGFAAALVSANTRSYLRAMLRTEPDAGRVLSAMNALLMEDGIEGRFVTLLFAVVDPAALKLSYASAGHCGYLIDSSGSLRVCLDQGGPPLGWHEGAEYGVTTLPLEPGDLLVLLTDGIEESMSLQEELFGRQRVIDLLRSHHQLPAAQIVDQLHAAIHSFHGGIPPHDDATSVVARILPPVVADGG